MNDELVKTKTGTINTQLALRQIELLPVKNDYVFSRLFGAKEHKHILICLLNTILNGKPHIHDLTLEPTEYRKKTPGGKSVRLDIVATSDNGTIINIELQCVNQGNIGDRASFYKAVLRHRSLQEGQDYSKIPSIISIWILGEPATQRRGCFHEIVDMYKSNGTDRVEVASEKTRQIIIELSKLKKVSIGRSRLNKMFLIWMNFINDPGSIPSEFLKIDEVKEAMNELEIMSMNKADYLEYMARLKAQNDACALRTIGFDTGFKEGKEAGLKSGLEEGRKKGHKEGHKEGRKEGLAEGRAEGRTEGRKIGHKEGEEEKALSVACAMLKHGDGENYIAQVTGLSVSKIRKLKKEI